MAITFSQFKQLDIRIGKILAAEKIEGADKLLKLTVDIGSETRQILAGVAQFYTPEELVGKSVPILANLETKVFRGLESQGMLLAADGGDQPILLVPEKETQPGAIIK